ncbi:MAG: hypothetical protein KF691_05670 [Phycisphaeraceae bacterium]|nr:hypothetical protein [Phycisphaeraceae bacterium]
MPRPTPGAYINASPALLALRRGAVFSALVVACAIVAQSLVFACVHYTDIRFEAATREQATSHENLVVVEAGPRKPIDPATLDTDVSESRTTGKADGVLAAVSNTASGVGVVALAVLVAQCWMATAIAAGAGVVGMQRAVRAANITTALFLIALPWSSAIPATPIWGVFCGYQPLINASSAVAAGSASELLTLTIHAIFPVALIGLLVWAVFSLSVGVSAGIVKATIDPVIEAEIAAVQEYGAGSLYAGRSAGDLQRIGSAPLVSPIRIAGDNEADRAMAELEKLAGRKRSRDGDEPLRPTGTDPLRRPI